MKTLKPCLFLDRDGIIIEDCGYPHLPEHLNIIKDVIPLIKWAKNNEYFCIVVTNQAGIAKGKFTEEQYHYFTKLLDEKLKAQGAIIDTWYFCPYHKDGKPPYNIDSELRKPRPGMINKALHDYPIDINKSFMVGDKDSDNIDIEGLTCLLKEGNYPLSGKTKSYKNLKEILKYLSTGL